MDYAVDEVNQVTLFNAVNGATITIETNDGSEVVTEVPPMEPNEVKSFDYDVDLAVQVKVTFNGVGAIASLGICFDGTNTPAPQQLAPPVETFEPSVSPSTSPSAPPSFAPIPVNECPEDVELVAVVGDMEYPEIPILIVEQTTEKVTFRVQNTFTETLSDLYIDFHSGEAGDTECVSESNVGRLEYFEYTAYCMKNCPITIVDIWAQDSSLAGGNNAVVPECCKPLTDHSLPTVQYTFKIHCDSQCPETYRRNLVEDVDTVKVGSDEALAEFKDKKAAGVVGDDVPKESGFDAHFCTSQDYPCGEEDDQVYVCHYSARRGYQTFCVSEEDSDIMSFYPKDYCGPCVGGYASAQVA
jgi:hypothetical protein